MSDTRKQHWVLLIAFALPLLLIGGLSLSVYWPQWQLHPQYDFVYTDCLMSSGTAGSKERCEQYINERITINDAGEAIISATTTPNQLTLRFFRHDVAANQSTEIPRGDLDDFTLSPLLTDPDGLTIGSGYEYHGGFFPFSGGSDFEYYLAQGDTKVSLNLIQNYSRYSYRDNFHFIGWILSE